MRTVRKPKQPKVIDSSLSLVKQDYIASMELFTDAHDLVTSLDKKRLATDGTTLKPMSLDFTEASYSESTKSLVDYVGILAEVASCVAQVFAATRDLSKIMSLLWSQLLKVSG